MDTGINFVNWNNSSNAIGLSYLGSPDDGDTFPTKPLNKPAIPNLTQHPEKIEQLFTKIKGISIVRLWISYKHEGLTFDPNCNITGIDTKYWLPNLVNILNIAQKYNCKMYLCLCEMANTGVFNEGDDKKYRANQQKIMQSYIQNPQIYITKVITPLIQAIGNHPALYAIDLINEPENAVESDIDRGRIFTMPQLENFAQKATEAIHAINNKVKVSVGCLNRDTAIKWSRFLDFADFHSYCDENLISYGVKIPTYNPADYNNKVCIIGECGYAHDNENEYNRKADQVEVKVNKDYVTLIKQLGYSAALPWGLYSDKGFLQSDAHSDDILAFLKTFR